VTRVVGSAVGIEDVEGGRCAVYIYSGAYLDESVLEAGLGVRMKSNTGWLTGAEKWYSPRTWSGTYCGFRSFRTRWEEAKSTKTRILAFVAANVISRREQVLNNRITT